MSSTYSTNLAIELMGAGEQAGNWGSTTNTNLGTLIEQAISGYTTQAVATGTDTTITIPNGATGVARNMFIELTGTGGASTNLIVPANKKLYFIYNNSTGAVTVKVSGQTGISVPAAAKIVLVSNGTDVVVATNYMASLTLGAALPVLSGGTGVTTSTGSGANVLSVSPTFTGTPTLPTGTIAVTQSPGNNTTAIATTAFVTAATGTLGTMSTQNANAVAITGGTVSGLSSLGVSGTATATTFSGAGTSLTGTAASLSIGGSAASATDATNILGNSSQTYQNVTGSRAYNVTYTNSTGKPIWVWYSSDQPRGGAITRAYVNGALACYTHMDLYPRAFACFIVPISGTYYIDSGSNLDYWLELR
jgi:hypothetical protein